VRDILVKVALTILLLNIQKTWAMTHRTVEVQQSSPSPAAALIFGKFRPIDLLSSNVVTAVQWAVMRAHLNSKRCLDKVGWRPIIGTMLQGKRI
jgi:hypothetical protein